MKFIHAADLHLGNSLNGIWREEEYEEFFAWLRGQIEETGAEALIVAGDVFDSVNPPNSARTLYYKFLASLIGSSCKAVVIVGGNHDSGSNLDASGDILKLLDVHVVGNISGKRPEDLAIGLRQKSGELFGVCLAVPFVRENELAEVSDFEGGEAALAGLYRKVYEAAAAKFDLKAVPVLATGHLYAAGLAGKKAEGEREIVGNLGNIRASVFPEELDYVALGHIHYQTMVGGNPKIRYSGSPFVMGFDETKIPHGVLLVETNRGSVPSVKPLIFKSEKLLLRRVEGDLEKIKAELAELSASDLPAQTFVEIFYDARDRETIKTELADTLKTAKFKCSFRQKPVERSEAGREYSEDSIRDLTDEEVFRRLISEKDDALKALSGEERRKKLDELYEEYKDLFAEILSEVEA